MIKSSQLTGGCLNLYNNWNWKEPTTLKSNFKKKKCCAHLFIPCVLSSLDSTKQNSRLGGRTWVQIVSPPNKTANDHKRACTDGARSVLQIYLLICFLLPIVTVFTKARLKTCDVQMSSNQTLFHENAIQGKAWRFENLFSTNRLQNIISQSDVIAELQEMLSTRLEHTCPTPVTNSMIVVSLDNIGLLQKGNKVCIFGYVQCNLAIKMTTLKKWIPDCAGKDCIGGNMITTIFRKQIADPNFVQIKVYQELKLQNNAGRKAAKVASCPPTLKFQKSKK